MEESYSLSDCQVVWVQKGQPMEDTLIANLDSLTVVPYSQWLFRTGAGSLCQGPIRVETAELGSAAAVGSHRPGVNNQPIFFGLSQIQPGKCCVPGNPSVLCDRPQCQHL